MFHLVVFESCGRPILDHSSRDGRRNHGASAGLTGRGNEAVAHSAAAGVAAGLPGHAEFVVRAKALDEERASFRNGVLKHGFEYSSGWVE